MRRSIMLFIALVVAMLVPNFAQAFERPPDKVAVAKPNKDSVVMVAVDTGAVAKPNKDSVVMVAVDAGAVAGGGACSWSGL